MTESEWLACADPYDMVGFLKTREGGWRQGLAAWLGWRSQRARSRKLHLFACACCRRLWHVLPDERSRRAVEVCERFVDGQARKKELQSAREAALEAAIDAESPRLATGPWVAAAEARAAEAVARLLDPKEGPVKAAVWAREAARAWAKGTPDQTGAMSPPATVPQEVCFATPWATAADSTQQRDPESIFGEVAWKGEAQAQSHLLRDIFANPFHAVRRTPAASAPEITKLAQDMYNERAFEAMPKLADSLKQAGSVDPDVLNHCLDPGPHVRGCWVVDLILGKS